uniref:Lipocalin-like n=1 Tax=Hippocampus comes TaxID=109280 RepID=A0A3Q2Y6I4_HIPCM
SKKTFSFICFFFPPYFLFLFHLSVLSPSDGRQVVHGRLCHQCALVCEPQGKHEGRDRSHRANRRGRHGPHLCPHKVGHEREKFIVTEWTPNPDLVCPLSRDDGTCWKMTHLAQKTETPGRFTFHSQVWNNDNDMRVVRVLYDNFALIHTIKTKEGVSEVLNKLYTRSPDVGVALQQAFADFCTETGILPENVAILPNAPECPEA